MPWPGPGLAAGSPRARGEREADRPTRISAATTTAATAAPRPRGLRSTNGGQ
jgi:hypothetical protein